MTGALPVPGVRTRLGDSINERTCLVEEIVGNELLLAAPDDDHLKTPDLDAPMTLFWVAERGMCELPVVFRGPEMKGNLRILRVRADGAVENRQRRQYVRVPVNVEVQLYSLGMAGSREGRLLDISEGGARCSFPRPYVAASDQVELEADLAGIGEIVLQGTVLRVQPGRRDDFEVILIFNIHDSVSDQVRKFVFSKEMGTRRAR